MFILFEGWEGSGKSTLVELLTKWLKDRGIKVISEKEPGGGPIGTAIRSVLLSNTSAGITALTEFFLFQASRAQLLAETIRPALEAGTTVVLDRYTLSTMAYQIAGRGLPAGPALSAMEFATGGLVPDITFLLDVSYETGTLRQGRRGRGKDRMEKEAKIFHHRVLAGYKEFAKILPWRIEVVGAEPPVEEVFDRITSYLVREFKEQLQLVP